MNTEVMTGRRMLAVAPVANYHGFNTSVHRVHALRSLGFEVAVLDPAPLLKAEGFRRQARRLSNRLYRMGLPVAMTGGRGLRNECRRMARAGGWDWLWLEKSLDIGPADLREVRRRNPGIRIVGFSPDDMGERHNRSARFIAALPEYDLFLTTKTYNVAELQGLGCKNVRFVGNGFDPDAFRPVQVRGADRRELGGDIGFIGTFESDRARHLFNLARAGLSVRVWGGPWHDCSHRHANLALEHKPLFFDDFAKACGSFKINLNFLRKLNRDRQTTRSVEIPACAGFMLAERTDEHMDLFREGVEADFFSSDDELLDKCRFYLAHDDLRRRIARAGRERCIRSGYSNAERIGPALSELENTGGSV